MNAQFQIWNEDCIRGLQARIPDDSVHLTVTSIPFEELFTYSGKLEDVGNNGSTVDIRAGRFALNMRFVVAQLFRVTAPGCNVCIHIQQLLAYKNQHGFMGRRDFRGAMIDVFGAVGFHFTGEFAIQKNPQAMANRLNLHSLQFATGYARKAQNLAPCPNDYVLIFQKPGEAEYPVRPLIHAKNPNGWMTLNEWVRDAHGIWTDILEINVLDGARSNKLKESEHEKHVCPLQLEVIRRLVRLYSNPADVQPSTTVLDPFMGIGTAWVCLGGESPVTKLRVEKPRNVIGFELKESYFKQAVENAETAEQNATKQEEEEMPLLAGLSA
uniref:DNA methyltransferase n=1 Tax=Trichococcus shcherbakoviae TaxID=2094020 RepID=UPI002AA7F007|nr:DNA methyltransferase [Trichococcus shcherbakoviae]